MKRALINFIVWCCNAAIYLASLLVILPASFLSDYLQGIDSTERMFDRFIGKDNQP